MEAMLRYILGIFLSIGLCHPIVGATPIKIGILDTIDPWFYVQTFGPTMEYLRAEIHDRKIETTELSFEELKEAVSKGSLDFFIAPSGFLTFVEESSGARHIATRHRKLANDPGSSVGSVFVARSDDSRYSQLEHIKGSRVVATSPNAFDGWITATGELYKITHDIEHFFGSTLFIGYGLPDVATIVLNHGADIGILKACELEMLENNGSIQAGSLKVLNEKNNSELQCKVSTDLYPDVVFASLPKATSSLIKEVSIYLLTMPETSNGDSWSITNDFSRVTQLYKNLQIGPYEYLRENTPKAIIYRYRFELMIILGLVIVSFLYTLSVKRIVRLRTQDLRLALEERNRAEDLARKSREQLFQLEKAGIVTGLSSMFAHEAQQPIASLINYAEGLKMYLQTKSKDHLIEEAVTEISSQAERLSQIINRVRSYAQQNKHTRKPERLNVVLQKSLETFKRSSKSSGVNIVCNLNNMVATVNMDSLEIELLLVNILRNAGTALTDQVEKIITITLQIERTFWALSIADNGRLVSDQMISILSHPTVSNHKEGLGLGLSICRVIAEAHGGSLRFEKNQPTGLVVTLLLPIFHKS